MKIKTVFHQRGGAMIEMALFLPVLLVIFTGLVDLSRATQFDNVLIHMSREGANLAKRTLRVDSANEARQVINALTATSTPLTMNRDGMIYITEITGMASGQGRITNQYRSAQGNRTLTSRLWGCSAWRGNHSCNIPGPGPLVTMPVNLTAGEKVYAVETRYDYQLMTGYLINQSPDLYAITVL